MHVLLLFLYVAIFPLKNTKEVKFSFTIIYSSPVTERDLIEKGHLSLSCFRFHALFQRTSPNNNGVRASLQQMLKDL